MERKRDFPMLGKTNNKGFNWKEKELRGKKTR